MPIYFVEKVSLMVNPPTDCVMREPECASPKPNPSAIGILATADFAAY